MTTDNNEKSESGSTKTPGGVTGKGWVPGKSGNPTGRPPYKSIRTLLQERPDATREEVIDMVVSIATGKVRARAGERIRAAEWIAKHGDDPTAMTITTEDLTITIAPSTAMQDDDDEEDEEDG